AREFLMKDAYSFHLSDASLDDTYRRMHATYCRIFERAGLDYRAVEADTGAIGGRSSHEFHVLADSGEDAIAFSSGGDYAANVELAAAPPAGARPAAGTSRDRVATPGISTIEQVCAALDVSADQTVNTLLVKGNEAPVVALVLRGDHELNPVKAQRHPAVAAPLTFASEAEIRAACGADAGSIGPVGLEIPVIADVAAGALADFVCGANETGYHLTGVNWGRDLPEPQSADLRLVVAGDPSPDGDGTLQIVRGIEVGHIFSLGDNYSQALNATVLDESGTECILQMGCYGIGVSRIVAAAIEQHHDENGIIWPAAIAPFDVAIVPINYHKSAEVREATEKLYADLRAAGVEVLLDDRAERPGVMFADMDLIGIPHRVVVGAKGLEKDALEYKPRATGKGVDLPLSSAVSELIRRVRAV
ncbi:MAG: proline--tRNA ligase, partial [Pseudomonadota bacterium]|nr:proline--tRNA ligase [Pseudomonadota bacterium]